jgi:sterol desaturase/sphingolipid hydroxylase (fatty acid hydroxylase superfamily)
MKRAASIDNRMPLFQNAWLERLTVVSLSWFLVTWGVLLPLIALAGWGAVGPLAGLGLAAAGLLVWSLFEYAMHRFLFHWKARFAPLQALAFLIHGSHHLQPNDRLRNLMPPVVSIPVALCIWGIFALLLGDAGTWAFLGFMLGYVMYDLTHFACHQLPMRSGLARAIKRHHMRHHHIDENANYAVTFLFWDRIFGSHLRSLKR